MIGVAFLNEIIFWAIGLAFGWMLGRKFQQVKTWAIDKGYIKKRGGK